MSRPLPSVLVATLAVGLVASAATIGNLATMPNLVPWYASLAKPSFNPPNWVFGPVWTLLYILMSIAFWRILRLSWRVTGRKTAITWFIVQLIFNALWSVVFFGLHDPLWGLIDIALLIITLPPTIGAFTRVDRVAGWLLVPYLTWVLFAATLNTAIWHLNG